MGQDLLPMLLEHAPAALAMFDRDMRYLVASRRWCKDFRLGDRPILGRSHYEVFPDLPSEWRAVHRRGLAGEVVRAERDRFVRADGAVQHLRWEVRPWLEGGQVGGILILSEDITAQVVALEQERRSHERVLQLNATLEARVAERTAELEAANLELDHFASAVSHDLRAPLRVMDGFARALEEDYWAGLADGARGYLQQIRLASRRMAGLIEGILTLSRLGRGELNREPVDVSALAGLVLAELARDSPGREVAAEVEPGLQVRGDPRMVEAVLRNLLGNAWKYTGGRERARIRVHGEHDGRRSWICVTDNGAGFSMDDAGQLFQPFRRLHRQDQFPGLGIGLATVHRIVRRHGGAIRAQAAPGAGARFQFTLEADERPGPDPAGPADDKARFRP